MAPKPPSLPMIHRYATTADGSRLSYYSGGSGPGILILHGGASFALTHTELVDVLGPFYTVHLASRRGRGLSDGYPHAVSGLAPQTNQLSPKARSGHGADGNGDGETPLRVGDRTYPRAYSSGFTAGVLDIEVRDVDTLLGATGATRAIGVSSGALVLLRALLTAAESSPPLPHLRKLTHAIIFEPPLFTTSRATTFDIGSIARFEDETAVGDTMGAMVTAMRAMQLGPSWVPRWVMNGLVRLMLAMDERAENKTTAARGSENKGVSTLRGLGGLLRYDYAVTQGMIGDAERWRVLGKGRREAGRGSEILLLSAGLSPEYLKDFMGVLSEEIKGARSVVVDGVSHGALGNSFVRGEAAKVAPIIREFFAVNSRRSSAAN